MGGRLFEQSADTVEGSIQHRRVDRGDGELPAATESAPEVHARSGELSAIARNSGVAARLARLVEGEIESYQVFVRR